MRIAAPEFGPVPLMELRVAIAAIFLLPLLAARRGLVDLRTYWRPIFVVGVTNSALPFSLFAYATLSVTAGFASILNATAPLFGAVVSYLWLRDRLSVSRVVGLIIGFLGVLVLVWDKASFKPGGSGLAIIAGLLASLLYGISANYTKKRLPVTDSLTIAAGSQLAAAIALLPFALWWWPAQNPGAMVWLCVVVLAVACTAIAYILYFRLIANVGPTKAITVTFLVPVFGVLWGAVFLDESVSASMLSGCAVILLGTALTIGVVSGLPGLSRRDRES